MKILKRIKKSQRNYLALIVIIMVLTIIAASQFLFSEEKIPQKIKKPSISIGCDRVLWNGSQLELKISTIDIDKPKFQWFVDDKSAGKNQTFKKQFKLGKYEISANVSFDNKALTDKVSILVINSIDGVFIQDSQEFKNQWKFQTLYNRKNVGVDDVYIYVDSLPKKEVNSCGYISIPLLAGNHTWRAEYHGENIASGNFTLKEVSEIKVDKIDIKSSYKTGDTVEGKIAIKNTGTTIIKGFDIKTVAINNKYKWMGDVAKREYYDRYDNLQLIPGNKYDIIVRVTIPKEVKGIAPTGKYSITINLLYNGKIINSKTVNTEVR